MRELKFKWYYGRPIKFILAVILVSIVCLIFIISQPVVAVFVAGFVLLIFIIPTMFLHFEYASVNKDMSATITSSDIKIFRNQQLVTTLSRKQIEKIVIYKSRSIDHDGVPRFPIEFYYFARVVPKEESQLEIIITCLMAPQKMDELRVLSIPFEEKISFFTSINYAIVVPEGMMIK